MAARSVSQKNSAPKSASKVRPALMKAAPAKAGAHKAVKSAKPPKAVKAAKPMKALKPIKGAPAVKSQATPKASIAKPAKPAKPVSERQRSQAAAAVEKVTERLMGRVSTGPVFDSVCREVACEGLGTSAGYCRLHYIKNWKKIKRKDVILKEGKLNQYIEELVAKYPEKYIEAIRQDLANDKEFAKVIVDLDLDENDDDFEGEGGGEADAGIDSIKREFEDETETF